MPEEPGGTLLRYIRKLLISPAAARLPDQQLLQRFIEQREEAAFAALLHRHGPLVHGVCRRVLGLEHDAEDAFQATFLVLAQKAHAIRRKGSLGSWLYGVAYRIAARARADAARRRALESKARTAPWSPAKDLTWQELCDVLDEELHRLPEKYRAPLVLCY